MPQIMKRRSLLAALAATTFCRGEDATRFFTLGQRSGRWWLITPESRPFFSIGLNHIDPSPLRYAANGDLWERKYGNSMEKWLKEAVAPDLKAWGFNSVG